MAVQGIDLGKYKLGWHDTEQSVFKPKKGLNEEIVREISWRKSEPEWMTKFRLNALKRFERKPMLDVVREEHADIDFDDIYYYIKPTEGQVNDWDMLPDEMKTTYERLGIPEAERKFLAGVTAQYECLRGSTLVWTTLRHAPDQRARSAATRSSHSTSRPARSFGSKVLGAAHARARRKCSRSARRGRVIGASGEPSVPRAS